MAVYITYHPGGFYHPDKTLPILEAQTGDRDTLEVSGTAANGTEQATGMIARIYTTEDVNIAIGDDAVAVGTTGEFWPEGALDVRFIKAGQRVSVISVA